MSTPIDRLSAEDRTMLWGDELWPQEIGALAVLDGGGLLDPDGRFRIEAVRDVIESRLHLVPRFRQRLHTPRRGLGGPLWVDAPSFDLANHVRVVPLPAPADEAELLIATEQLRRWRPSGTSSMPLPGPPLRGEARGSLRRRRRRAISSLTTSGGTLRGWAARCRGSRDEGPRGSR